MNHIAIHEKTLLCAKQYQKCEAELVECLQLVKKESVYQKLGYTSLHVYAVQALGFSDDQAYQFTRVAIKALDIPELQSAIIDGTLNVSKARRVLTVITPKTQAEWITKAATLPQRELEKEIVLANPKELVRERVKPLTSELSELRCSIPVDMEELIRRVRDLESKKLCVSADLAQVIRAGLEAYLEKNDPVCKAHRVMERKAKIPEKSKSTSPSTPSQPSASRPIPTAIRHDVNLRDDARCVQKDANGRRCENKRWTELHHVKARSHGGAHTIDNLVTLCSQHHRQHHVWQHEELH